MKIESTIIEPLSDTAARVTLRLGAPEGDHILICLTVPVGEPRGSLAAIQATALAHAQQMIASETPTT